MNIKDIVTAIKMLEVKGVFDTMDEISSFKVLKDGDTYEIRVTSADGKTGINYEVNELMLKDIKIDNSETDVEEKNENNEEEGEI